MGMTAGGFSWKTFKKYESTVFLREWTFLWQNMAMRRPFFLANRRLFYKIWALEQIFLWKIRRKKKGILLTFWAQNICSFGRIDVFLTKYGHDSEGFYIYFFFNGMRAVNFSEKSEKKKGILLTFWAHNIIFMLTKLTFFLPNMGMAARGFSWKIWKKRHKSTVFLREATFLWQNMDMRKGWFLEIWRCLQNMGMRAVIFSWKIIKKGILLSFLDFDMM